MGLSDFSGGVQEALAQLIKDRLEAEEVQRRAKQQEFQNQRTLNTEGFREREFGEGTRRFDLGHEIDTGNLGLRRDEFGLQKREYEEGEPMRAAALDYTQAQTGDILRRPEAERQDRDHDVSMTNLQGTWGLRTIGAQGSEQRRTQSHGASLKPAGVEDGGPSPYAQERNLRNKQSVQTLLQKVNNWTAGAGSLLSSIPATEARDFKAQLDTLKANVAFGELTAMREASKTGGALGGIAIRELELLESALGALDQGQSPESLKQQLQQVYNSIDRWETAAGGGGGGATGRASGAGPGPAPARPSAADLIRKYSGGG